jgi:hypothetical protein
MKMSRKKAQAALEFMATYGWAMLVIMIAIGALSYFGFSNPAKSLPDKCMFGNGIICQDSRITTNSVNVSLINGIGKTIYDVSIVPDFAGSCRVSPNASVSGDSVIKVDCSVTTPLQRGTKTKLKLTANYKKIYNGYNQVALGEVYGTVQ